MAGRKRTRRTGYLREKSGGRWEVVVSVRDPLTGGHRKVSRTMIGTRKQAEDRLARLRTEIADGDVAPKATTGSMDTYSELLDRFIEAKRAQGLSPTTTARYESASIPLREAFGDRRPDQVGAEALEGLYGRLLAAGKSPGTVRKVHEAARGAGDLAFRYGRTRRNLAADAKAPRVNNPQKDAPTPAQVKKLIETAAKTNPTLAALIHVGAATGARRGELLALRWSDVDLDAATMSISRALILDGKKLIEKRTKTGAGRRITLDSGTVAVLRDVRTTSEKLCAELGGQLHAKGYVFSGQPDGSKAMRPDSVTWAFSKVADRADLDFTFYESTRHFAASELVGAGMDLRTTADRLGHDVRVLLSRYAHRRPGRDEAAAEMMASVLAL